MRRASLVSVLLIVALGCATATAPPPVVAAAPARARVTAPPPRTEAERRISSEAYLALLESELKQQEGDAAAAIDLLRQAVLHDGDSAYLHIRLGEAYVAAGDFEAAAHSAREALQHEAQNVDAMRLLASAHDLSGDREQAKRVLHEAFDAAPSDRKTATMLAELLVQDGLVGEAEAVVERNMAANPSGVDAWVFLARVFAERGDVGRALVHLDRALERAPHDVDALTLKLHLLDAQGRFQEALPLANAVSAEVGDSPETRSMLLSALLLAGREDDAATLATMWIDADGGVVVRATIADAYETAGHRAEAIAALSSTSPAAKGGRPQAPELAVEAARMSAAMRRWAEARALTCDATTPWPDKLKDYAAALCVGALLGSGEAKRAGEVLTTSLTKMPGAWRLVQLLGRAAKIAGTGVTPAEAAAIADKAAAERPNDIDMVEAAARVHEDLGRLGDARALLDTALRARPKDAESTMALARFLERNGQRPAAIELAERLLDRQRADVDLLNFVAFSLAEDGARAEDARRYAWRALVQDPLNGYVVDTLGWAELKAGDAAKAVDTLTRADRLSPDEPEILLHLAEAQRQSGRGDDAKKTIERARVLVPKDDPLAPKIDALVGALSKGTP